MTAHPDLLHISPQELVRVLRAAGIRRFWFVTDPATGRVRSSHRLLESIDGLLSIGRSAQCSIPLESALVSRHHATLELSSGGMRVHDSSRNGTLAGAVFVNNSATEVPLNTPLVIGEFTISVRVPGHVDVSSVPPPAAAVARPHAHQQPPPAANAARAPTEPPPGAVDETKPQTAGSEAEKRDQDLAEEAKRREAVALRREIHRLLLEHLDLATVEAAKLDDPSLRSKILVALRRIVRTLDAPIPPEINRDTLRLLQEVRDAARSVNALVSALERRPNSLLFGR